MWALINKSDLTITQLFEVFYLNFDAENFIQIEVPEGLNIYFLKCTEAEGMYTISEDTVAMVAADKTSRIAALNVQTWATIMAQAKVVYGTDDPVLVLASQSQLDNMVANPGNWVGPIFSDTTAVLAYATPKMAAAIEFGNWRLGVLMTEAAQKAAILAE